MAFLRCAVVLGLLLVARNGAAQVEEAKPWARGVPKDKKAKAKELFKAGNLEFEKSRFLEAAALYRKALEHWEHPDIRFDLAVSLIHLDQPLEALTSLDLVLQYGDALEAGTRNEAQTYHKLLEGRVAKLEVRSDQPGVEVSLDGQPLVTGPGAAKRTLLPGPHSLVARKRGHITDTRALMLIGGREENVQVKLRTLQEATTYKRRWETWVPWAVVGAGVVAGAGGYLVYRSAQSDADTYDSAVASQCPSGCTPDMLGPAVIDLKSSARSKSVAAIGAFGVGGAAIVTGIVMVIMNQPRAVLPEEGEPRERGPQVVPSALPGGAQVSILGSF